MTTAEATTRAVDLADLLGITRRLTDLATAEIASLRAMRPKDIRPLQEEKAALVALYESELGALTKGQALDPDPGLAAELREGTRMLRSVLADNKRALEAARYINHKLVQTIGAEIARRRNPGDSYGKTGQIQPAGLTGGRPIGPLKLDARV